MSDHASSNDMTGPQKAGLLIFVFLCGFPALELNGFGMGLPISLFTALTCATIGGALGGALICSKPMAAGLVGGLLAGPLGLLAVYYYTQQRESVWTLELVLVQGIACLPGLAVGRLLKRQLAVPAEE